MGDGGMAYEIPASSRFTLSRNNGSEIIYYYSTPHNDSFPIAIVCGGSSSRHHIMSIINIHRYFLKELLGLGCAVITIEQQGVDGNKIDVEEFIEYYTRSIRLADHEVVINTLGQDPPQGWNGKFIFIGVSEGGPLVTTLTERYSDHTIATINWVGAGDWSWRDELWVFMKQLKENMPWYQRWSLQLCAQFPKWAIFSMNFPTTRKAYDNLMDQIIIEPITTKEFMGMTYAYHADALVTYPVHDYHKIKTPFLVVAGTQDSIIESCDMFVQKANTADAPISYIRVPDMDHYIRKRPDIIEQSFAWLQEILDANKASKTQT